MSATMKRADAFCARFGLRVPILLAPTAGGCLVAVAGTKFATD
jgi:hypothetical protein